MWLCLSRSFRVQKTMSGPWSTDEGWLVRRRGPWMAVFLPENWFQCLELPLWFCNLSIIQGTKVWPFSVGQAVFTLGRWRGYVWTFILTLSPAPLWVPVFCFCLSGSADYSVYKIWKDMQATDIKSVKIINNWTVTPEMETQILYLVLRKATLHRRASVYSCGTLKLQHRTEARAGGCLLSGTWG